MMKKALALLTVLMLAVTFGAQAKTIDLTYEGVSFDVPDDFEPVMEDEGDTAQVFIFSAASLPDASFVVSIGNDENEVKPIDEHDDAALEALFESASGDLHEPAYTLKEVNGITFMVITEATNCEVIYLTIYESTYIHMGVFTLGGTTLTQDQTSTLETITQSLKVN